MSELRFTVEAPVAPEVIIDALTDFTDRRPSLWPDLDPAIYRVDELGPTHALVREGQRRPRLWALEEYDWSTPNTVTWTARESNFCTPGSYVSARVEATEDGSRVHLTFDRTGTTLKGKMIVAMVRATKGKLIAAGLGKAMANLKAERRTESS